MNAFKGPNTIDRTKIISDYGYIVLNKAGEIITAVPFSSELYRNP